MNKCLHAYIYTHTRYMNLWLHTCIYTCIYQCKCMYVCTSRCESQGTGSPMCSQRRILMVWFFKKILPWVLYLFSIMSDVGEARRQQVRCRKWISIVVRRCSYTTATEAVLPSIHYATSVISRSGAALRWYCQTLFKNDMEIREDIFLKNHPPKILSWEHIGEPLPWDSQRVYTCIFMHICMYTYTYVSLHIYIDINM